MVQLQEGSLQRVAWACLCSASKMLECLLRSIHHAQEQCGLNSNVWQTQVSSDTSPVLQIFWRIAVIISFKIILINFFNNSLLLT